MGAPWPEDEPVPEPQAGDFDLEARKRSHWAWQPVAAVEPPAVSDEDWPAGPVDRFLLAKLDEERLKPASPADRYTLIRRLSFDLTGLPPTPEQIRAFVQDKSPDAYPKLVRRLLDSPHFGERWARHWMDLVRYAESHGSEGDPEIPVAWRYRNYLIRALNNDVPYDQLILEHLAGDLLENPRHQPKRRDQRVSRRDGSLPDGRACLSAGGTLGGSRQVRGQSDRCLFEGLPRADGFVRAPATTTSLMPLVRRIITPCLGCFTGRGRHSERLTTRLLCTATVTS